MLVTQAIALVRYVILARLLGPEQLGLAATLIVTASFFDLISDTGADRFLIQDKAGDDAQLQKAVQLTYIGRGFMIAVMLVVFAVPLAALYKAPQLAIGFVFLSLAPLARGFLHLDMRRAQRRSDFRPEAKRMIVAELAGIVVLVAAALIVRNFTAVIWGAVARDLARTVSSHMLSERRYGLGWSREHGPRLLRFAYPLMLTGLMLFIGSQGDRVVVAHWLGMKGLGLYSAVLLLIYVPANVVFNYIHALYVPMVAAERDYPAQQQTVIDRLGGLTILLAVAMCAGFALVAPLAVTVLYGHRYTQSAMLVGLFGILQCTRFLMNWPTTVNLSLGQSRAVLASNVSRFLAYPCAFAGVTLFGGLRGMVAGFAVGEMASIAIALILMNRGANRPLWAGFDRLTAFVLTCWAVIGWNLFAHDPTLLAGVVLFALSVTLALWIARREADSIADAVQLARRVAAPLFARREMAR
jgi:O-antigen/teichoic acid export membrane protein